jgi:uncharacterized protein (TIGR01319 family)
VVRGEAERLSHRTATLPTTERERAVDLTLGRTAAAIALRRHAGTIELNYGPDGPISIQTGKDLRRSRVLIGTGGIFAANPDSAVELFAGCVPEPGEMHLIPKRPDWHVDSDYILYAVGLLAEQEPQIAYRAATRHLARVAAPCPAGA